MHYFHNFQIFFFFYINMFHYQPRSFPFKVGFLPLIFPKKITHMDIFIVLIAKNSICLVIFNNSPLDQTSISSHNYKPT